MFLEELRRKPICLLSKTPLSSLSSSLTAFPSFQVIGALVPVAPSTFYDILCCLTMATPMFGGPQMGGGNPPQAEPTDDGKFISLVSKMDKSGSYARNEASGYPMTNLFIGDTRLGCKSDADEQLILHIEFQEFVKVSRSVRSSYRSKLKSVENRGHVLQVGALFQVHNTY